MSIPVAYRGYFNAERVGRKNDMEKEMDSWIVFRTACDFDALCQWKKNKHLCQREFLCYTKGKSELFCG